VAIDATADGVHSVVGCGYFAAVEYHSLFQPFDAAFHFFDPLLSQHAPASFVLPHCIPDLLSHPLLATLDQISYKQLSAFKISAVSISALVFFEFFPKSVQIVIYWLDPFRKVGFVVCSFELLFVAFEGVLGYF
jgi:hypothetical protein